MYTSPRQRKIPNPIIRFFAPKKTSSGSLEPTWRQNLFNHYPEIKVLFLGDAHTGKTDAMSSYVQTQLEETKDYLANLRVKCIDMDRFWVNKDKHIQTADIIVIFYKNNVDLNKHYEKICSLKQSDCQVLTLKTSQSEVSFSSQDNELLSANNQDVYNISDINQINKIIPKKEKEKLQTITQVWQDEHDEYDDYKSQKIENSLSSDDLTVYFFTGGLIFLSMLMTTLCCSVKAQQVGTWSGKLKYGGISAGTDVLGILLLMLVVYVYKINNRVRVLEDKCVNDEWTTQIINNVRSF
jgi:GTPase SAR1 family protein